MFSEWNRVAGGDVYSRCSITAYCPGNLHMAWEVPLLEKAWCSEPTWSRTIDPGSLNPGSGHAHPFTHLLIHSFIFSSNSARVPAASWASSRGLATQGQQGSVPVCSGKGDTEGVVPGGSGRDICPPPAGHRKAASQPCGTQGRCPRRGDPQTWPAELSSPLQNGMKRRVFQEEMSMCQDGCVQPG